MLYLSPFKISMFLECPRRYKFHYIDGLAEKFKKPKPHFTMGENVHRTLKEFYDSLPPQKRTKENLENLLREIWRQNRAGFRDREEEKKFGLLALSMLNKFYQETDITKKPLLLEKSYKINLSKEIILQGKIDRVDLEGDGLVIIDYKTGKEPEDNDYLQLIIYSIIISQKINKQIKEASYWYLKNNCKVSINPTEKDLENGILEIKSLAEIIKNEKKFKPNINKFCNWCEYLSICPMKEEIEKNKNYNDLFLEEPF